MYPIPPHCPHVGTPPLPDTHAAVLVEIGPTLVVVLVITGGCVTVTVSPHVGRLG